MTTADYLTQLQNDREDLVDNLEAKGITGLSGDETFTELVPQVLNIPSGGGSTGEFNVKVIDYDGTILKDEWHDTNDVVTLPSAPSHTGLTFQEWSATQDIINNTVTVVDRDVLIGPIYTTTSGLSEFDIKLNTDTGLEVTFNMDGIKNWGDGTSDTATSHTYSNYGKYTITCDGTTITTSSTVNMFGRTENNTNSCVTNIRLAGLTTIPIMTFAYEYSLMTITLPKGISMLNGTFFFCRCLKTLIIPKGVTSLRAICSDCFALENLLMPNTITTIEAGIASGSGLKAVIFPNSINSIANQYSYLCQNSYLLERAFLPTGLSSFTARQALAGCYNLKKLVIPDHYTSFAIDCFNSMYAMQELKLPSSLTSIASCFRNCRSLKKVIVPSGVTTISAQAFQNCYSIILYDFRNVIAVPTLANTNAFQRIHPLCKIVVPDSLYSSWITANNWSTYADYIVKASDYTE